MRVFCFAEGVYEEKLGGGGRGVAYRLFLANKKYHLIPEMIFVFGDSVLDTETGLVFRSDDSKILSGGISGLMAFYSILDEKLHFSSEDIYIFHDFSCFYALKNTCSFIDNTAVVYHGQGSLYHEALIYGLNPDEEYRSKTGILTEYVLSCAQKICFPSEGAMEAFLDTSDESVQKLLADCSTEILYNGCLPEKTADDLSDNRIFRWIEQKNCQGKIFVSVAVLNEAKGVEQLPAFFRDYGKSRDYLWIIIGNGPMSGRLKDSIRDISDHVLWITHPVPNEVIISLYERADYYILAHRISIFDFATIEAMHMGMIPVLTPVGGNMAMICDDNGYFLKDDLGNSHDFIEWEDSRDIPELKEKNRLIARQRFSDRSMLEFYRDLAEDLGNTHSTGDLLVITPDLELNGAQVVLNELLSLPVFRDMSIDLISPSKGPYGRQYEEMGINILIRPYIAGDEAFRKHLIGGYKRVLINTSSCSMYLMFFMNTDVPVFYWLHETFTQLGQETSTFLDPRLYSSNIHLLGVTHDVLNGINKRFGRLPMNLLPMPVADPGPVDESALERIDPDLLNRIDGKILFFFPAAYTLIKGQDIFLQAVAELPEEFRTRAHFVLCGYRLPKQDEYYRLLKDLCEKIPEVTMLDELSREDVYLWYRISDCVLATSRVDATPTSIVEAMMFGKITLVSDAAGISRYLTDCVNSFVFPSENVDELKKRMLLIIHDYDKLDTIGMGARLVYEENFSPEHVNSLLEKYFSL